MMNKKRKSKPTMQCERHGLSRCNALCKHLCHETGLRYFAIKLPPGHPYVYQAWCERCHAVLEEEGGWTDRSTDFAGMMRACTACYKLTLRRHQKLAPLFMEPNESGDNEQVPLGFWEQEIVAALAYDLAARAMGYESSEYKIGGHFTADALAGPRRQHAHLLRRRLRRDAKA